VRQETVEGSGQNVTARTMHGQDGMGCRIGIGNRMAERGLPLTADLHSSLFFPRLVL